MRMAVAAIIVTLGFLLANCSSGNSLAVLAARAPIDTASIPHPPSGAVGFSYTIPTRWITGLVKSGNPGLVHDGNEIRHGTSAHGFTGALTRAKQECRRLGA
jgi:hypothetical protein